MKVLLVRPPFARPSFSEIGLRQEPVSYTVLAPALVAAGHEVRFVDLRATPDLGRALGDFRPDAAVLGVIPLVHGSLDRVLGELCRRFRKLDVLLFPDAEYGNMHALERPEDYFHPLADALSRAVYLHDLIELVPELMSHWQRGGNAADVAGLWVPDANGEWQPTESRPDVLGDYGVPDRTILGAARGSYSFGGVSDMAFVYTSFGCPYACRYCPMSKWTGELFERRTDDIVAELASLEEANVFLSDFEPLQLREHMLRLADAIQAAGVEKNYSLMTRADSVASNRDLLLAWKDIGLKWVYVGLDGHSRERLREIRKGASEEVNEGAIRTLTEMGLHVSVGFLVRSDFTTRDFRELRDYVRALDPPAVGFTVETPLVGTTLYDDEEERITTRDWSLFDLQHAVLPTSLPLDRFYRELVKLHLFGLVRSTPAVLRGMFPLRDQLKTARIVAARLPSLWFGARQHRSGPGTGGFRARLRPSTPFLGARS